MADEKSGEVLCLFESDRDKANWLEWSAKMLALAKTKGNCLPYANNTKPCSDTVYKTSALEEEKLIYKAYSRAYQLFIVSCIGIAFGLVNQAKTKDLIDRGAFVVWKNLCDRFAPHELFDLIQMSSDFSNCVLDSSDPDEWFIKLDLLHDRMTQINSTFEKGDKEVIAHILIKLRLEYSGVGTNYQNTVRLLQTSNECHLLHFATSRPRSMLSTSASSRIITLQ